MVIGLVVVVAAVGAGVPAVAGTGTGADVRVGDRDRTGAHVRNRPPATPTGVGTVEPASACAGTRAPSPLRSLTPTLAATLSDPDGGTVSGVFSVHDRRSGRRVWGPVTTVPQASGLAHTVVVPPGVLVEGRRYGWRVAARDDRGRTGRAVRCGVVVDVTAPGVPRITAVAGTAPAVYAEDQVAGGVGLAGEFRLESDGAADVVAFRYTVDGGPHDVPVDDGGTGVTVTVVPTTSGPHVLTAQAVDAAGNVGPERLYRFTVAAPRLGAAWRLDEGTGAHAADSGPEGDVHPLTLHGGTAWGDGPLRELGFDPADGALVLGGAGDTATTTGPVVDTAAGFSVLAFVRADTVGPTASAVSQDGAATARFSLGRRAGADCPGGTTCWAFTVAGADEPGATHAVATASVPVQAGSWVLLVGLHDAAASTAQLAVCEIGSAGEPAAGVPVHGPAVPTAGAWAAPGPVRLGGAVRGGALGEAWAGAIGSVSLRSGVVDAAAVRRGCARGIA